MGNPSLYERLPRKEWGMSRASGQPISQSLHFVSYFFHAWLISPSFQNRSFLGQGRLYLVEDWLGVGRNTYAFRCPSMTRNRWSSNSSQTLPETIITVDSTLLGDMVYVQCIHMPIHSHICANLYLSSNHLWYGLVDHLMVHSSKKYSPSGFLPENFFRVRWVYGWSP
jgi:hypothetical protein